MYGLFFDLALAESFEVALCLLYDYSAKSNQCNHVRDCHESVNDIGDCPYCRKGEEWSDEYGEDVAPSVCCKNSLLISYEVLKAAL